jgi:two-component system OmpR family response regulator
LDNSARDALRVLIVDDNRDAADSLASLLEMYCHEVRVAYDGATALSIAQSFGPDCMFADIRMPGLDGYDLARQVRRTPELGAVKLVAMSAFSDDEHVRKATEAGFDYRLTKGCGLEEILEVLTMIVEIKKLAQNTQALAAQNVELAEQTKDLLREVKEDVKEVKEEVKALKKEVQDLRNDQPE